MSISNITTRSPIRVFCYCGCLGFKPLDIVRYWLEYKEVWGSNKEGSAIVRVTELWESQINLRKSLSRRIISYSTGNLSIVIFSLSEVGSTCGDVIHMDLIDCVVKSMNIPDIPYRYRLNWSWCITSYVNGKLFPVCKISNVYAVDNGHFRSF